MRYYNLLTFALSFTLSSAAFLAAQHDEVPVQHIEFLEDYEIQPRVETYVFDDYVIQSSAPVIDMDEVIIIAQEDESDDGDGANIDWMNDNWCLIHPDDEICQDQTEEDEVEGC